MMMPAMAGPTARVILNSTELTAIAPRQQRRRHQIVDHRQPHGLVGAIGDAEQQAKLNRMPIPIR